MEGKQAGKCDLNTSTVHQIQTKQHNFRCKQKLFHKQFFYAFTIILKCEKNLSKEH